MGWTYTERAKGTSTKDFFKNEFRSDHGRVLDCASVGNTVYVAYEVDKPERAVFAFVCLTSNNNKERYNFGYKDMDESTGPFEADCPKRILDLLTPTDNKYALEWRAKCRENLIKKASKPKITSGIKIKFSEPIKFINGKCDDTFEILDARRLTVRGDNIGYGYKLARYIIKSREYVKVG